MLIAPAREATKGHVSRTLAPRASPCGRRRWKGRASPVIRHSSAEELSQMSDPIIVGTDASADADRAVDWAADEAALRRRPLRIVHSLDKARRELPLVS